jgi:hypothetical protein
MGLRDENPLVDSDLELIITTFEKSTSKSRDIDSVLVPFKRELVSFVDYPQSIVNAIDGVKTPAELIDKDIRVNGESPNASIVPEYVKEDALTPSEDGDDDEDWTEKVKNWVAECVPCTGEFKRTISSMNADFFLDIGEGWDAALNETWDKLMSLEDLLDDADVTAPFCDLGNALKFHCVPDIKKMMFILTMLLDRMEIEIELDLSIFDSFLTAALSPIFNELAANLDLIDTLALEPIRCVLEQFRYQINNAPKLAGEARSAILDPIKEQARRQRQRINTMLAREREEEPMTLPNSNPPESELAADRARYEEQIRLQEEERIKKQMTSGIERASQAFEKAKSSFDFLSKFKDYVETGKDYLEDKKKWLLNIIEEFVNTGLDRWNNQMKFAKGKTDLLTFISIMKAMVEAANAGDFSCGPESGSMTEEDVARVADFWLHPSESLEVLFEDGNIITRRHPDVASLADREEGDTGVIIGDESVDKTETELSNIVVKRPVSSCLKKVTNEEVEQVKYWISQLEQEV